MHSPQNIKKKNQTFCYNRTKISDILHEDLSIFWREKFLIKALLCNTHCSCIVDSDV